MPPPLQPVQVLRLQRTVGNRATVRLLTTGWLPLELSIKKADAGTLAEIPPDQSQKEPRLRGIKLRLNRCGSHRTGNKET